MIAGQGEAGSDLRLQEDGKNVTATLRDYLGGGKLMETHLPGTLAETRTGACRIHLSGSNKDGQVEIDGEITIPRFQGTATRHIGKEVFTQAMSLRRQLPSDAPAVGRLLDNLIETSPQKLFADIIDIIDRQTLILGTYIKH